MKEYLEQIIDLNEGYIQSVDEWHSVHFNSKFPYKDYFKAKGQIELAEELLKKLNN